VISFGCKKEDETVPPIVVSSDISIDPETQLEVITATI
jgi:hypothetical protein